MKQLRWIFNCFRKALHLRRLMGFWIRLSTNFYNLSTFSITTWYIYIYNIYIYTHTHTHTHTRIYKYIITIFKRLFFFCPDFLPLGIYRSQDSRERWAGRGNLTPLYHFYLLNQLLILADNCRNSCLHT